MGTQSQQQPTREQKIRLADSVLSLSNVTL